MKLKPNILSAYWDKRAFKPAQIQSSKKTTKLFIVVPSYDESTSDLSDMMNSLEACSDKEGVELIIVLNSSENESIKIVEKHKEQQIKLESLGGQMSIPIHILNFDNLPQKKAGVGLARKLGMDEACRLLSGLDKEGIIVCLDADTTVMSNYLKEIKRFFSAYPKLDACSIGFIHQIDGMEGISKNAIIDYELHLRYFIHMQQWINLPFAYQTVGSAMAIRAKAYAKEGGMPILQAGEDFYFMHKFIKNQKCGNLSTTCVYPSARVSTRVPFGTGRAVQQYLLNPNLTTYHPESFKILIPLIEQVSSLYESEIDFDSFDKRLLSFLDEYDLKEKVKEIKSNCANQSSFIKRFYQWFDAFLLMKYVHYMRDKFLPNIPILEASNDYFEHKLNETKSKEPFEALERFRRLDYPFYV